MSVIENCAGENCETVDSPRCSGGFGQSASDTAMMDAQQDLLQGSVESQMGFDQLIQAAAAARDQSEFGAQNQYYQSLFDALERQTGRHVQCW